MSTPYDGYSTRCPSCDAPIGHAETVEDCGDLIWVWCTCGRKYMATHVPGRRNYQRDAIVIDGWQPHWLDDVPRWQITAGPLRLTVRCTRTALAYAVRNEINLRLAELPRGPITVMATAEGWEMVEMYAHVASYGLVFN